jgi:hypothetical protein
MVHLLFYCERDLGSASKILAAYRGFALEIYPGQPSSGGFVQRPGLQKAKAGFGLAHGCDCGRQVIAAGQAGPEQQIGVVDVASRNSDPTIPGAAILPVRQRLGAEGGA